MNQIIITKESYSAGNGIYYKTKYGTFYAGGISAMNNNGMCDIPNEDMLVNLDDVIKKEYIGANVKTFNNSSFSSTDNATLLSTVGPFVDIGSGACGVGLWCQTTSGTFSPISCPSAGKQVFTIRGYESGDFNNVYGISGYTP